MKSIRVHINSCIFIHTFICSYSTLIHMCSYICIHIAFQPHFETQPLICLCICPIMHIHINTSATGGSQDRIYIYIYIYYMYHIIQTPMDLCIHTWWIISLTYKVAYMVHPIIMSGLTQLTSKVLTCSNQGHNLLPSGKLT